LIALVLIVVVIAVVAFIAYPMFLGDNKAKAMQPDLSSFPDGWSVKSSESVDSSSGLISKEYYSREWYVKGTEHIVAAIQVFPSADKAAESYDRFLDFHGPGTPVTKFDKCFKSGGDYYFVKGNTVGQVLTSFAPSLTAADINSILDSIEGKI